MPTTGTDVVVLVRVPAKLGLTQAQLDRLEEKWLDDLNQAAAQNSKVKVKIKIGINIEISNE